MGRYKVNNDGTLGAMISGRGKAEYGASTMRTGRATLTMLENQPNYAKAIVTFEVPMPDANYEVILSKADIAYYQANINVTSKTVNGFNIAASSFVELQSTAWSSIKVDWCAFKLYTDTEYNELLDANNWKYISCTKTEVGVSAVQAALSQTPPANMKEFYIEFEIAGGKLYTFFAPKGGDANLINALNNPQYHCYAYGTIMSNNTLQCTMTSKGAGYSSYPLYVTGMYYR